MDGNRASESVSHGIAQNWIEPDGTFPTEKMDGKTAPLKYEIEEGVENPSMITIKCTDADGKENKEECPCFTNGKPKELLQQLCETILALNNRYEWIDNSKGQLLFQHFGRSLKGEPLRKWNKIAKNNRTFTENSFKDKFFELVEECIGEDAYQDQLAYLEETEMPD